MKYHINTDLILEKFNRNCDCPLCEIEKKVEEQFIYEFLNDAVMEDSTRIQVNKSGFCDNHFDKLFEDQNKLGLALQVASRITAQKKLFNPVSPFHAKTQAKLIEKERKSCVICDLIEESMKKYYKTVAEMYYNEPDFYNSLLSTNGFCTHHYAMLIKYSSYAKRLKKDYIELLSKIQQMSISSIIGNLQEFCFSHDYRRTGIPLGEAERALKKTREKLYGKK